MRDVIDDMLRWWRAGEPAGLATVTATWSSAPRQPGAAMVVGPDGAAAGSVSGGCVEGAVYELCREVAVSGATRTVRYGVTDDDAYQVGLPCGGTIELLVERVDRTTFPELPLLAGAIRADRPVALLTSTTGRHLLITPDDRTGSLGGDRLDDAATDDGRGLLPAGP